MQFGRRRSGGRESKGEGGSTVMKRSAGMIEGEHSGLDPRVDELRPIYRVPGTRWALKGGQGARLPRGAGFK